MMARVRHETRDDLDFGGDEPEGAQVILRLVDGRELVRRIGAARGMPADTISDHELRVKFVRNTGGGDAAEAFARRLMLLEREPDCGFIAHGTAA
jgi:hypothetical protein